jgi:hypothetical protein
MNQEFKGISFTMVSFGFFSPIGEKSPLIPDFAG